MADRATRQLPEGVLPILLVMGVTSFLMMLNETSVSVALPAIMEDFDVPASTAQWLLTGVRLTMAILMPATGWVIARFPVRRAYAAAVTAFLAGTLTAALSPTFEVMLAGRVLQAVGPTIMMPLQTTVAMLLVPAQMRGAVLGTLAVVFAVGPALGPTYAGFVLSLGSWHLLYWVLIPCVALCAVAAYRYLRNSTQLRAASLDAASVALSAVAFGGIIYSLSELGAIVEGQLMLLAPAAVGVVAVAAFVWRQRRLGDNALLDLTPFATRNFTLAVIALLFTQIGILGVFNLLPLYLQGALLTTAVVAGMANLPGGIIEVFITPLGGRMFDRVGPRAVIIPGLGIVVALQWCLVTVSETTPVWLVVVLFAVQSIGVGLVYSPLNTTALSSLDGALYGYGAAISSTFLQVAGAAGTAIAVAIYSLRGAAGTPAALAEGTSAAFFFDGVCLTIALVLVLFLRNPAADAPAAQPERVRRVRLRRPRPGARRAGG